MKAFHIEREKGKQPFSSFNHVNRLHKKIDLFIIVFSMITFVGLFLLYKEESIPFIFFALIIFSVMEYVIRAFLNVIIYYSQNPKQAILTISDMLLFVIRIIFLITFF